MWGSISINVDVDIDDILWELSSNQKQELVDDLYDDGYIPAEVKEFELFNGSPQTHNETELLDILTTIWGNKRSLTQEDINTLTHLSRK
jgi:hypothetical protein